VVVVAVFIQALHLARAVQVVVQMGLVVIRLTTMALLTQVVVAVVMAELMRTLGVVMAVQAL
jgi:hypothetical protein